MMQFSIPCDVFVRLAAVTSVIYHDGSEWCRSVRIQDNIALASNRKIMVLEKINLNSGICHIAADPVLVEKCTAEAPFESVLTITVDPVLKWAMANTTFGYIHPGNACVWSDAVNELNDWRKAIPTAAPLASEGAMLWDADLIAMLGKSSPTRRLVFPEFINAEHPIVIRDALDDKWCGIFIPRAPDAIYGSAKLPEWLRT